MSLRRFGWHHYYLALGTLSATLGLVLGILAPRYVLPLAVATMAAFSGSALANAYLD